VPQSLVRNFWHFGSCGAGLGRRSLLAIFQFPFRHSGDWFYLPDAVKLLSRTIPTFHFRERRWPLAKPAAAASPARVKLNFVDFRAGKHGMENCGNPPGPGVGGRFSIDQVVARFDQKTCEAPAGDLLV
jgi:hypothetical protein